MTALRNWTNRISDWANNITAFLLLSMFVVFILQITFRYLVPYFGLNLKIDWTDEWVTTAWMWGILFGFTFVIKTSDMIRLDVLYNAVPTSWQRVMDVFVGLITAAIFAYTLPYVWDYVTFMKIEVTAAFRWRFDYVFSIYIPFHIAVIVRMLLLAWGGITGARDTEDLTPHPETHDYD